MSASHDPERPLILYDGTCYLCNGSVNFIIRHQAEPGTYYYIPFQSDAGRYVCRRVGADPDDLTSFLLIDQSTVAEKSTAWIRIAGRLTPLWRACAVLARIVPRVIRDTVYDYIGRKRYAWFGRSDVCLIPADTAEGVIPEQAVLDRCLDGFPP